MKKFFSLIVCFCFTFMFNVSFALSTSSFSIDLPGDFKLIEQDESSGKYSNDKITISYKIVENEPGEYWLSVREIKENSSGMFGGLALILMGLDKDAVLVTANNTEFLRSISEDENMKTITYLGTTAKKMTTIRFSGEELNESQVESIMATIDLKGFSGATYELLLKLLIYGVGGFIVIGLPLLFKFLKLKKKNQEAAKQEFNNINNLEMPNQEMNTYESDIRNDWKF